MSGWVSASCKSTTKTLSRSEIVWFCPSAYLHPQQHSCSNIKFYLSISQISSLMTSWPISWWELRGCIFQRMTCGISPSLPLNLLMRDFSLHAPLMSIYGQLPCTSCPLYTLYSSCTLPQHCLAVFDTAVCLTLQCVWHCSVQCAVCWVQWAAIGCECGIVDHCHIRCHLSTPNAADHLKMVIIAVLMIIRLEMMMRNLDLLHAILLGGF